MIYISKKDEFNRDAVSDSKEVKKESQYLLRVVYDSEDEKVHKLLESIFGPDQMLDVKNGKVAKINSTLTPKQRDYFLGMVSEAVNKAEEKNDEHNLKEINNEMNVSNEEKKEIYDNDNKKELSEEDNNHKEENSDSKKVSAEKLIKEFASFLNNIS